MRRHGGMGAPRRTDCDRRDWEHRSLAWGAVVTASRSAQSKAKMVRTNQKSALRLGSYCIVSRSRRRCLEYIKVTAGNLYSLTYGVDFRDPTKKITSDQAFKLTSNALSLSRQGKKNAFASLRRDRDNMRAALDKHYYGRDSEVRKIKQNSTTARRIALGNRLLDLSAKLPHEVLTLRRHFPTSFDVARMHLMGFSLNEI
jgi:hypothetical protein